MTSLNQLLQTLIELIQKSPSTIRIDSTPEWSLEAFSEVTTFVTSLSVLQAALRVAADHDRQRIGGSPVMWVATRPGNRPGAWTVNDVVTVYYLYRISRP